MFDGIDGTTNNLSAICGRINRDCLASGERDKFLCNNNRNVRVYDEIYRR